jgi:hypothetical protein
VLLHMERVPWNYMQSTWVKDMVGSWKIQWASRYPGYTFNHPRWKVFKKIVCT